MSVVALRSVVAACLATALMAPLYLSAPAHAIPGNDRNIDDGTVDNPSATQARHGQNGSVEGHMPPRRSGVEVVSKLKLNGVVPGRIADVAVFGDFAYLAAFNEPKCTNGGVYIVDIKNVKKPKQVGFVPTGAGSFVSEGAQVVRLRTSSFRGDVLVFNNEICGEPGPTTVGGATLVDVTNPRRAKVLAAGFGDLDPEGAGPGIAHQVHSAFAWTAGKKAYAVLVDDEERSDVDIFDITNPRKPKKVKEYDLATLFPKILQKGLDQVFLHDMVVKKINGRQLMLASYWDAGYVVLDVTNPAKITYVADSDFKARDPELFEQSGLKEASEGNAHQAEFTMDNKYIVAADEDFSPTGLTGSTDDGAAFGASQGDMSKQLAPGQTMTGTAVYAGLGCTAGTAVPAAPASGGPFVAVVERGVCTFNEKVANVEAAGGYAGVVIVNREGSDACGSFGMTVTGGIPVVAVDRRTGYGIFDLDAQYDEAACRAGDGTKVLPAALGMVGDVVTVRSFFNGWGYVHLYGNNKGKLKELDTYAIPEAMDSRFATGFGDLSVHEAATSRKDSNLAYLSYYAGGLRVVRIVKGKLVEVGAFIDKGGNNFWGVDVFNRKGTEYVAASDRDFGLYIFRYTGKS